MALEQKTIYVFDDFSYDEPMLLGNLYVNSVKGGFVGVVEENRI